MGDDGRCRASRIERGALGPETSGICSKRVAFWRKGVVDCKQEMQKATTNISYRRRLTWDESQGLENDIVEANSNG